MVFHARGGGGVESGRSDETRVLRGKAGEGGMSPRQVILEVFAALQEKGYDPVRQIAYYLLTGEPAYITGHRNARSLITRLERDEVLEELVRHYLSTSSPEAR